MKIAAELPRLLPLLVAAALCFSFLLSTAFEFRGETFFSLFDDAMISMRYARNLVDGHGLVWNPGEAPVEGYSNLAWTLLMAAAHVVPVPESKVSLVVMLIGAATLLANVGLVGAIADRLSNGRRLVGFLAATLVASYYPIAYWTLRGMEVGLLALVLSMAVLRFLRLRVEPTGRNATWLAVPLGLALLVRPDAALPVGVVFLFAVLDPSARRLALERVLPVIVATVTAQAIFRWIAYGDLLPNTYYLKMTGVPLADRIGHGLASLRSLFTIHLWPVAALALVAAGTRRLAGGYGLLLALFVTPCAYSVWVGGDAWEWMEYANRYISVAMPFALVLAVIGLEQAGGVVRRILPPLGSITGPAVVWIGALAIGWHLNAGAVASWREEGAYHVECDAAMARAGILVREATTPDARIAVVWAGALPYFARRPCVDLLGKNDRTIARGPAVGRYRPGHDKWDYHHSIGRLQPDVILQTSFVWRQPGFWPFVRKQGYEQLRNGILLRRGSDRFDRERLASMEKLDR